MFKITERFTVEFQVVFTNVLNHNQWAIPPDCTSTPAPCWLGNAARFYNRRHGSYMRQMPFGLRLNF